MEVVASLSQGRTAAAQCGLFTHKSVPVIFEPPCILQFRSIVRIFRVPCLTLFYRLWVLLFETCICNVDVAFLCFYINQDIQKFCGNFCY